MGDINRIYEDSKGQIWVGSYDHGLLRLNESKTEFQRLRFIKDANSVEIVLEDSKGNIWVSILNKGIYVLDASTGQLIEKFETDTKDVHGLLSNRVRNIVFRCSWEHVAWGSRRQ